MISKEAVIKILDITSFSTPESRGSKELMRWGHDTCIDYEEALIEDIQRIIWEDIEKSSLEQLGKVGDSWIGSKFNP